MIGRAYWRRRGTSGRRARFYHPGIQRNRSVHGGAVASDVPVEASQHADLELASGLMLRGSALGIAMGMAFGAPDGVKPLKPTVWPCSTNGSLVGRQQWERKNHNGFSV
jgi:hypothetical protein